MKHLKAPMKHLKALLSLICMLAMILCSFAACKPSAKENPSNSESEAATGAITPEETEFDYENGDRLDPTLDFANEQFSIYTWNTQMITEWVEQETENMSEVEQVLYQHLTGTEDRLNVDFKITTVPGRYNDRLNFVETLESYTLTGLSPDLVCQYSLTSTIAMLKGLYSDLAVSKHIDFDAPWWNDSLVEGNKIKDKLYYITGDITPTVPYNMYGIQFNKELLNAYELESPYQLVRDGNWTYSRMLELIKDTSLNPSTNNQYGGSSENVMYGLVVQKLAVDAFQAGFGVVAVQKNDNGIWNFSRDYTGSKAVDAVDAIRRMVYENTDVFYDMDAKWANKIFIDRHTIFSVDTMYCVESEIEDHGLKVGVVPTPKFDAAQTDYATRLGVTVSVFAVPMETPDYDRSTAVLEAFGSNGYRKVTPVVFEKMFCARYADAPDDAEMFMKIRDCIVYDPGNFHDALSSFSAFRNCVRQNLSWSTYLEQNLTRFANALSEINKMDAEADL